MHFVVSLKLRQGLRWLWFHGARLSQKVVDDFFTYFWSVGVYN